MYYFRKEGALLKTFESMSCRVIIPKLCLHRVTRQQSGLSGAAVDPSLQNVALELQVIVISGHVILYQLDIGYVEHDPQIQTETLCLLLQLPLQRLVHVDPPRRRLPVSADVPQPEKLRLTQTQSLGDIFQALLP